jgi:predicted P-loop ATPase
MAHLTHDLEQSTESQKRRLTPAELCSLWRSAPYKLAFNELTQEVELDHASLPVVEIEEAYIGLSEKGYNADPRTTFDSVLKVAREQRFHPVQRYFERIEKDDSIRPIELSTFSRDYFGTSDRLYDSMWAAALRGAVWRVFRPGCQFDFVLTLKGAQGIRKSTSFLALMPNPDWMSSSTHDQAKDMTVALHRTLITELAELEHITGKRSTGALKNHITTRVDLCRVPYGKAYERLRRRSIMVASVNGDEFLRDHTGDRRFWVVDLGHRVIDTGKISKDRDRIWKAAIAQFRQGLSPCLSHAEQQVSDRRNESFRSENIFLSAVEEQCLGKLKDRGREAGFDTRFAINESGVCEGRPPGQTEMLLMSQCLRELGFVQDRNATRDPYLGRSRKWRLSDTSGTSSAVVSVPSQSTAKTVD